MKNVLIKVTRRNIIFSQKILLQKTFWHGRSMQILSILNFALDIPYNNKNNFFPYINDKLKTTFKVLRTFQIFL